MIDSADAVDKCGAAAGLCSKRYRA